MGTLLKVVGALVVAGFLALVASFVLAYVQSSAPKNFAEAFSVSLVAGSYSNDSFCPSIANAKMTTHDAMMQIDNQLGNHISFGPANLSLINITDSGRQYVVDIPTEFEFFQATLNIVVMAKGEGWCIAGWHLLDIRASSKPSVRS